MAYEHKPNRFSLLQNKKKRGDNDPSYTGDGLVDLADLGLGSGRAEVWVSLWRGETQAGDIRLSGSIRAKTPKEFTEEKKDFDDDIPF